MDRKAEGSSPSPRERPPALYVITRKDLSPGLAAAQVIHAAVGWVAEYGTPPESVVVLATPDETVLWAVLERLNGQRRYGFNEPDLDDALTAIAAGPECRRVLSSLPLLK